VLQRAQEVDTILFDKTGTLTKGQLQVVAFHITHSSMSAQRFWLFVGSVEVPSEHVLGKALVQYARDQLASSSVYNKGLENVEQFVAQPGKGVKGSVRDKDICIGTASWLQECGVNVTALNEEPLAGLIEQYQHKGQSVLLVAVEAEVVGLIAVADEVC